MQVYAQNTFNEVLGWYGLCASSTATPTLTTTSLNTGQTVVSSCATGLSTTNHDDADLQLIIDDRPLDLTCNTAVTSRQCSLLLSYVQF